MRMDNTRGEHTRKLNASSCEEGEIATNMSCSSTSADGNGHLSVTWEESCFVIDTNGHSEEDPKNQTFASYKEKSDGIDLSGVLSNSSELQTPNGAGKERRKTTCFNCLGNHVLAECTEKRDLKRISRNRNSFRGRENTARFHEQSQMESSGCAPGRISDDLRRALGLGRREIPEWIFRMRKKGFIHGYPPAYLKRAIETKVLPFFEDAAAEQGLSEMAEETIDPQRMISYPAFNYFDRALDDPESFRIPPWELFIKCHQEALDQKNAAKRRLQAERARLKRKARQKKPPTEESEGPVAKRRRKKNKSKKGGTVPAESFEEGEISNDTPPVTPSTRDGENSSVETSGKTTPEELEEALAEQITASSSTPSAVIQGTPILLRKDIYTNKFNHEVSLPSLESFAQGINPYRHSAEEEKERSGFLDKIGGILRSLKKKKDSKKPH